MSFDSEQLSPGGESLDQKGQWTWKALQKVPREVGELLYRGRISEKVGGSSLSENEECHDDDEC